MRSRLLRIIALLFALSLVAAACGNDSDGDGDTAGDTGGDADGDTGGDTDGDADGDADGDTGGDTDGDADGDADGDTGGDADGDADGDTDGTDGETAAPCDATVPGTSIDYAPFFDTRSFDPPYSSGALVGGDQLIMLYDVLMRFNDQTGEFEPHLAEGMESNEDFTVWTLKLRDGIEFGDGTPFDAEMVKANMDRFFEPEGDQRIINTSPAFLQFVESSEVIDPLTLEMTLTQPWATFPFVFNDEPGMIVNTNAIGDDAVAFGAMPPPEAGVGPYILESRTPGEEAVFKARDDYWGGPVCIETITFQLAAATALTGSAAGYEAFKNGDLDIVHLRNETALAEARADGAQESMALQDGFQYLVQNLREGTPLNDPVLREGIALAIDADIINERAYGGDLTVGKSFALDGGAIYTPDMNALATDPERAAELIAEAGFDGTIRVLCSSGPEAVETSLAVEAMLEAAGLTVEVENLPTTDQIAKLATGDYDIGCWGVNAGPDTSVSAFVRNFKSDSPSNRAGFGTPELDQLLSDALAAEKADVPGVMTEINNYLVENFIGIPIGQASEGIVLADNVKGVKQTGSTIFMFDDAYIEE